MSQTRPTDVTTTLLAHRDAFKGFLKSRVGSEADAEDLLQIGLVKALERAGELKDGEKLVPWFYQVLRNAIVDHVRSRSAAVRRDEAWVQHSLSLRDDPEVERQICGCFEKMLATMKPARAELLRSVDLQGEPVAAAAGRLGLTPNHASVALHRARAELRRKLIEFCGDCACLDDCGCDEPAT